MQIDTSQIDDTSRELGFHGTGEQKGRRIKIPSTKTISTPPELTSRVCCCAVFNAAGWIDWREFQARPGQEWAFGCTSPIKLKSACLESILRWTAWLFFLAERERPTPSLLKQESKPTKTFNIRSRNISF
jgi:hypothetical protein